MTLHEQITQDIQDANPATIADLGPLKLKYRNLCNTCLIDYLAKRCGYFKNRKLGGYNRWVMETNKAKHANCKNAT